MTRLPFHTFVILAAALACAAPADQSAASNARAREVLDAVRAAAGGDSALNGVATLVAQYEFTQATSPPIEVLQARDFTTGRNLYEVHAAGPPEAWERVVMEPGRAFAVNMLTNEVTEYDTPTAAIAEYSELQLRWYVYQPVSQALAERVSLRHLGDSTIGDDVYDRISFLHDDLGEVRLLVDRSTSRLRSQSWEIPGPVSRRAALEYRDYQVVDGYPMPMTIIVTDRGVETARYDMIGVQINVMLQESAFQPPAP